MTVGTFILIMIFGGASHHTGGLVVQQEFNSMERCEVARVALEKANSESSLPLRAQGCFKK